MVLMSTGPPGHEPAVDFLSSSGSSQAIEAVSFVVVVVVVVIGGVVVM